VFGMMTQTIVPMPMPILSGGGGGDPDYLLGAYIASNVFMLIGYIIILILKRKSNESLVIKLFWWEDMGMVNILTIFFVMLNFFALLMGAAVFITESFIK
jgi:hypothetical protein